MEKNNLITSYFKNIEKNSEVILLIKSITKLLQWVLNFALIILAGVLLILLGKQIVELVNIVLIKNTDDKIAYILAEQIVVFFLYFEFLELILKYFKAGFHFPLRYFLYIGITAMIRLIIIDHSNSANTLLFSAAVLIMVIALRIVRPDEIKQEEMEK
ncbi:phosphate-starvation-inducible protein PsiE [Mergibacter septicus]|nr:phosphate-starvation-inducible protein PsiE [Mergibacter septicus]